MTEANNIETKDLSECSQESLLKIIKDQNKELKLLNKKLTKVEEKFIKMNTDFKMIQNDKSNIESFLKIIFPKEMYEKLIKTELGLYDCAELNRFWVVVEGAKQNDYQKYVNQVKLENSELIKKYDSLKVEMECKTFELEKLRVASKEINDNAMNISNIYNEIAYKYENVEKERNILLNMLDEKEKQIEKLSALEIENAELKAKNLLEAFDTKKDDYKSSKKKNSTFNLNVHNEKHLNISSINTGTQTTENLFNQEYVNSLENEIVELKKRLENYKKEFQDHRERSNKIIMSTEENYKKLLKENEAIKASLESLSKENNDLSSQVKMFHNNQLSNNDLRILNNIKNKSIFEGNIKNTLKDQNISILNPNMSIIEIEKQRISIEYLKNVLLKYLEAIAIGNEFQTKILENVIFAILNISNHERVKLEEKRTRSSFYYNLWYNAKAFLSARIYGNGLNPIPSVQDSINPRDNLNEGNLGTMSLPSYNVSNFKINEENNEKLNKFCMDESEVIEKKDLNDIY